MSGERKPENLKYERSDWTLFRSLDGLRQRTGLEPDRIARLIVKELVDNSLDAAGACRLQGLDDGSGFFVEDDGPGIPVEALGRLFSINRPLESTKYLRRPSRGCMGIGLRLVTGAVLASQGTLEVCTQDRRFKLSPDFHTGDTAVEKISSYSGDGFRVDVRLGPSIPFSSSRDLYWGKLAILMGQGGSLPEIRTSAYYYDTASFHELLSAAGKRTVREEIRRFDGCAGGKAGQIARGFLNRSCSSLSRREVGDLLKFIREATNPVSPKRLGTVGALSWLPNAGYHCIRDEYLLSEGNGSLPARIPFVVESWAEPSDEDHVQVFINRSPVVEQVSIDRNKGTVELWGCGLYRRNKARVRHPVQLYVNVQTPYMPLLNDGKAPDLAILTVPAKGDGEDQGAIAFAIERAAKKSQSDSPSATRNVARTQKEVILDHLDAVIRSISDGGRLRWKPRQAFYQLRPIVKREIGEDLHDSYLNSIITDVESEKGSDLPSIYRDARGNLIIPHTREMIAVGTIQVEGFRRPEWTFNKVVYVEKEGFTEILLDAQWPERHDCALLMGKGQPTRAARDLIDFLGDTGEPIEFFCIHDADGPGTIIYQSLNEGTKARPARHVSIVDLGLHLEDARSMRLEPETFTRKRVAVAESVSVGDREWYQSHRYELDSMTSGQFIEWLDTKMRDYAAGKVVPPSDVLRSHLRDKVKSLLRDQIIEQVLSEARIEERTENVLQGLIDSILDAEQTLDQRVRVSLNKYPEYPWSLAVEALAGAITARSQ